MPQHTRTQSTIAVMKVDLSEGGNVNEKVPEACPEDHDQLPEGSQLMGTFEVIWIKRHAPSRSQIFGFGARHRARD